MTKILTANWENADSHLLAKYEETGGYSALEKVLSGMEPDRVIERVKSSGVRGRGGAGFPAGMKWGFVPQNTGKPIYLCVNADESEPGTNKDREILERDPHMVIEGAAIAAYAIRSSPRSSASRRSCTVPGGPTPSASDPGAPAMPRRCSR